LPGCWPGAWSRLRREWLTGFRRRQAAPALNAAPEGHRPGFPARRRAQVGWLVLNRTPRAPRIRLPVVSERRRANVAWPNNWLIPIRTSAAGGAKSSRQAKYTAIDASTLCCGPKGIGSAGRRPPAPPAPGPVLCRPGQVRPPEADTPRGRWWSWRPPTGRPSPTWVRRWCALVRTQHFLPDRRSRRRAQE
jgi:hypothetical protein